MKSIRRCVRDALALHLDRPASSIHPWDRLDEDLDVTPLELVLVALDVEELAGVPIPIDDDIATVLTVGDLYVVVTAAVRRARQARDFDLLRTG
jgi:hypothetical protein